jgi:hypothetical protein
MSEAQTETPTRPTRTTTLWGRTVAVTKAGTGNLSRPTVRAFLRRLTQEREPWTAIERSHFDGMIDGSVATNVPLSELEVEELLKDRGINAYVSSTVTEPEHIVLFSHVETVEVRCTRIEDAFRTERQRRLQLVQELEPFAEPVVVFDFGRGGSAHSRDASVDRARFVIGNCNDGDPIAADERAERVRAWGSSDAREVIARLHARPS